MYPLLYLKIRIQENPIGLTVNLLELKRKKRKYGKIPIKYKALANAKNELGSVKSIRKVFIGFQEWSRRARV